MMELEALATMESVGPNTMALEDLSMMELEGRHTMGLEGRHTMGLEGLAMLEVEVPVTMVLEMI